MFRQTVFIAILAGSLVTSQTTSLAARPGKRVSQSQRASNKKQSAKQKAVRGKATVRGKANSIKSGSVLQNRISGKNTKAKPNRTGRVKATRLSARRGSFSLRSRKRGRSANASEATSRAQPPSGAVIESALARSAKAPKAKRTFRKLLFGSAGVLGGLVGGSAVIADVLNGWTSLYNAAGDTIFQNAPSTILMGLAAAVTSVAVGTFGLRRGPAPVASAQADVTRNQTIASGMLSGPEAQAALGQAEGKSAATSVRKFVNWVGLGGFLATTGAVAADMATQWSAKFSASGEAFTQSEASPYIVGGILAAWVIIANVGRSGSPHAQAPGWAGEGGDDGGGSNN